MSGVRSDHRKVFKIFFELVFLLTLALVCDMGRRLVRWSRPSSCLVKALHVASLVCGWYSASITLILFNKWVISHWMDTGLSTPIFYTMTHMMLKGAFAFLYLLLATCKPIPSVDRRTLLGACIVGCMTGLDVAASNLSFGYISVAFFTMLKCMSIVFSLLIGVAVGLERCSWAITSIITVISMGIFISSYSEARFSMIGFTLVVLSEVFAGVRWITTQAMLKKDAGLSAVGAVFCMAPASTLSLVPLVLAREINGIEDLRTEAGAATRYCLMVLPPGFLAFVLLLIEVQLVKETSALTLSVFGNLKSVITIIFAIVIFEEEARALQWVGLSVAVAGMLGFSHVRRKQAAVAAAGMAPVGFEMLLPDDEKQDGCGLELAEQSVEHDYVDSVFDDRVTSPKVPSEEAAAAAAAAAEAEADGAAPTLAGELTIATSGEVGAVVATKVSSAVQTGAASPSTNTLKVPPAIIGDKLAEEAA